MGGVLLPLNIRLASKELAYILKDSGSRVLFFDPDFAETGGKLQEEVPTTDFFVALEKGF